MVHEEYLFQLDAAHRDIFEQNVQNYVERINKTILRRSEKEAHECCANCCDAPFTRSSEFHDCTEICAARLLDQRDFTRMMISQYRASLERCALSCKDASIQMQQKAQHMEAIEMFTKCCDRCIQDHLYRLPQVIEAIVEQIQLRFVNFSSSSNTA